MDFTLAEGLDCINRKLQSMATIKLALPFALLCGLMVIGCSIQNTEAKQGKICPMYCLDATFMTCPPNDTKQLQPVCNCCLADKKGCTIYLSNGGVEKCP
ncbi:proteinase inhibitor type-2-like [Phragmites australis]|uniref:proteinase inhibitor type-2-like n=1 Tax=Phragmites australis TaxID=29695 RepID=UPI002D79EB5A|nr:proteinase inhibitor type-2-like [Phragmites australis]